MFERAQLTRRTFVQLAAGACAGCYFCAEAASAPARTVDAGPVAQFAADGVYDRFRNQGFFIVRRGQELTALSSICTHRAVHLEAEPDHSFLCPRHGSKFSPAGQVVHGPARRDLPVLTTTVDPHAHLLVNVPAVAWAPPFPPRPILVRQECRSVRVNPIAGRGESPIGEPAARPKLFE